MYRAMLLLPLATLVLAGTESSCDSSDSSCQAEPDKARSMLQHEAQGIHMMNQKLSVEEQEKATAKCEPWCVVDNCAWKVCMDCAICDKDYVAPTPVPPPPPTGGACQPWCVVDNCAWKVCLDCSVCNAAPTPPPPTPPPPPTAKPTKNVLLIMNDDLNVDVKAYGHAQAYTPNIDKLAQWGTRFDRAYAQHPVCVPSRASFITGIYGINTKSMFTDKYWEFPIPKNSRTLVEHFSANGYATYGTGKIGHKEKPNMFDEWGHDPDYGPLWVNEQGEAAPHPALKDNYIAGSLDVSFGSFSAAKPYIKGKAGWHRQPNNGDLVPMRYVDDSDRDLTPDEMNAEWTVNKLGDPSLKTKVWFMAVGFVRPHTPLHALDKHFEKFPLESLSLPVIKTDDTSDTNFPGGMGRDQYNYLISAYGREEGLKLHTQAYLASVYAVDEQIGKVLDALEVNGFLGNTIVVLVSDHGWHEGQKDVLWKNTAWEEATRIPFIIADPDFSAGQVVEFPVALIDVYPTLIDLCGLSTTTKLNNQGKSVDGVSLKPLLENPSSKIAREGVVSMISNYGGQWVYEKCTPCTNKPKVVGNPFNHHMTVRTKEWRYIWVADGTEELYDHTKDEYEWTNLIGRADLLPNWEGVRADLRKILNIELEDTGFMIEPNADAKSAVPVATYR